MEYSIYLINKNNPVTLPNFTTALEKLSEFNRKENNCPVHREQEGLYLKIYDPVGASGKYELESFALDLVSKLIKLGYAPSVVSEDFGYGDKEDIEWLNLFLA